MVQHRYPGRGLHGELVQRIGLEIVNGSLAPGAVIPADGAADDDAGASRTAFREAIKVLTAKGLVESKPRLGTRVRQRAYWNLLDADVLGWQLESDPELHAFGEVIELRLMIEPAAARLATQRATQAEVKKLRTAYVAMTKASEDGSLEKYLRADVEFHQGILAACHNEMVEQLASVLRNVFRVTFSASASIRLRSLVLHEHILTAIENRDPDAADEAMRVLIVRTNEMVRQEFLDDERASRRRRTTAATPR